MSTNETQITDGNYEVNIDFDEASREWNANKKKSVNGYMIYCCGYIKKNGKPCKRPEKHRVKHT